MTLTPETGPDVAVSLFLSEASNWSVSDLGHGLYRVMDEDVRVNIVGTLDTLTTTFSALLVAVYRVKESETPEHVN